VYARLGDQPFGYEAFMRAVERFDHQDYVDAIARLPGVIALDSTFGSAYSLLAVAYSNVGRWAAADSVAKIADRWRDRMSKPERAQLDWTVANIKGDLETTHRIAQEGAARDSSWVSLWLTAYHALFLNRPRETVRILSAATPPRGWWPQWNALGSAHHLLGEFDDEFRVAQDGNAAYPGRLVFVELRALGAKGDMRRLRGIMDSVESASTDTIFTPADLMLSTATELRAHGRVSDAAELLTRARKWMAARPQDELRARRSLRRTAADLLFASGQFDSAQVHYAQLAAEDTFPFDVKEIGRVGSSAALRGDTVIAKRAFDELGRVDRPYSFGEPSYWRAAIAATLGQKESAVRLLGEALSRGARKIPELHRLEEFESLRGYPPFQAMLRPKG
jgi:tetratricopeptide (TPR) repeat protein